MLASLGTSPAFLPPFNRCLVQVDDEVRGSAESPVGQPEYLDMLLVSQIASLSRSIDMVLCFEKWAAGYERTSRNRPVGTDQNLRRCFAAPKTPNRESVGRNQHPWKPVAVP
jgi:hypothetical protein